jgi:hypothetical protein
MRIDIEEVEKLLEYRHIIESIPIKEVEWYKNGFKLNIPEKALDCFRFIGLSNLYFIKLEWYKPEVYEKEIEFLKDII